MGRLWAGFWHPSRAKWAFWNRAERADRAECARREGDGVEGFGLLETFFWKEKLEEVR